MVSYKPEGSQRLLNLPRFANASKGLNFNNSRLRTIMSNLQSSIKHCEGLFYRLKSFLLFLVTTVKFHNLHYTKLKYNILGRNMD